MPVKTVGEKPKAPVEHDVSSKGNRDPIPAVMRPPDFWQMANPSDWFSFHRGFRV